MSITRTVLKRKFPISANATLSLVFSQFSCLCKNQMWIDRMNDCVYQSCNKTQEDSTFVSLVVPLSPLSRCFEILGATPADHIAATFFEVAQLCAIFGATLTLGPEATASIVTSDPVFNTQGVPSASTLPPVMSESSTQTPESTGESATAASTAAPSSTAQGSRDAPASATSNAAAKGVAHPSQSSLLLLLTTFLGLVMRA